MAPISAAYPVHVRGCSTAGPAAVLVKVHFLTIFTNFCCEISLVPRVLCTTEMHRSFLSLLLLLGLLRAAGSAPSCQTAFDCSLAGTCNAAGQCDCFAGFLPPDCGGLALGESRRAWLPENQTTWGGSPIKFADGMFHLYAAMNRWGSVDSK